MKLGQAFKYLIKLFFSFEGRITPHAFIFGILFLALLNGVAIDYLLSDLPESIEDMTVDQLEKNNIVVLMLIALFTWPILALAYKRRHDIGKPGKPFAYIYILSLIIARNTWDDDIISALEQIPKEGVIGFYAFLAQLAMLLFVVAVLCVSAYMFFQMAVKDGDKGPNKYGPDPLAGKN